MRESETDRQTPAAASYYRHVTQKFHGNRIFISRMLNRNPKRLSAEVFSSAQKQPKQNASSQNREENGSTTLRNTREKPLLAGYFFLQLVPQFVTKKSKMRNYHIKTKTGRKTEKKQKGRKKESLILNLNKTLSLTLY